MKGNLHSDGTPRLTPEEQARRQKAAKAKYDRENKNKKNERRNEKSFRFRKPSEPARQDALAVTRNVDRPKLLYLDAHGNLHKEKELSAERLIAQWQKREDKKRERNNTTP